MRRPRASAATGRRATTGGRSAVGCLLIAIGLFWWPCGDSGASEPPPNGEQQLEDVIGGLSTPLVNGSGWLVVPSERSLDRILARSVRETTSVDAADWPEGYRVADRVLDAIEELLETEIDEDTRAREDRYLELLTEYSQARSSRQSFDDLAGDRAAIQSSLNHEAEREAALDQSYLQNLERIALAIPVMAVATWDGEISPSEFRRTMEQRMSEKAAESGLLSYVSATRTTVQGVAEHEFISEISGSRVEAFEGEPLCMSRRRVHTCLQVFRCMPELATGNGSTPTGRVGRSNERTDVQVTILEDALDPNLRNSSLTSTPQLRDEVEEQFARIEAFNDQRLEDLAALQNRYVAEKSDIAATRRELEADLNAVSAGLDAAVEDFEQTIGERAPHDDSAWPEWMEARIGTREAEIDSLLDQREYIAFTTERQYLDGNQTIDGLKSSLARQALANLEQRRHQLLTRTVVHAENGMLTTSSAQQYYDQGRIVALALPAFVISYPHAHANEAGGTEVQGSIVLAVKIRFDRAQSPAHGSNRVTTPGTAGRSGRSVPRGERAPCDLACRCGAVQADHEELASCLDPGMLFDPRSGLIWSTATGPRRIDVSDALHYARSFEGLEATAWRLPTVRELLELTPSQMAQLGLSEIRDYWTSDRIGRASQWGILTVSPHHREILRAPSNHHAAVVLVHHTVSSSTR
jgi:hypothetical protein